ncbi:hypothetical protein LDENG_00243980, partial [Lucifuga dentata]
ARRSSTAKYLQIVRQVLRNQLKGRNKIQAINNTPYQSSDSSWNKKLPKEEIEGHRYQDTKTPHNTWRVPAEVQQPETVQSTKRRGPRAREGTTIQDETRSIHEFIRKMTNLLRQWKTERGEEEEEDHGRLNSSMGCTTDRQKK